MGMEIGHEIETRLKRTVDQTELLQATDVRQLVEFLSGILYGTSKLVFDDQDSHDSSSEPERWSNSSVTFTPPDTGMTTPSAKEKTKLFKHGELQLSRDDILECFGEIKMSADRQLCDLHLDNIDRVIIAGTSRLTTALIVEAFEKLGCSIRNAAPGEIVERVKYLHQYERLMEWIYGFLETDARLIDIKPSSGQLTRTAVAVPNKSSEAIRDELLRAHPEWAVASKLIYHSGKPLASILSEETDGIRVLFGSSQGRDLVAALYRGHPFNIMLAGQMCDLINRLMERVEGGTLKILEMGAGGTTVILAPFLASLYIPVEYTFTDLSSAMVAAARRNFGKKYSSMRFAVHDIEQPPAEELCGQHIIVASNAVHATHNLVTSATNIRKAMRLDGFVMLLEQTECMPFSNLIFGLLEGWWLFDDGRTHTIVSTERWERDLQTAGFGHVDWTDGKLPENNIQRVIVALASGPAQERLPIPQSRPEQQNPKQLTRNLATQQVDAEKYVSRYTYGWVSQALSNCEKASRVSKTYGAVVVVTGATGSLGSHLVATFAENPHVKTVVCLNRRNSGTPAEERQANAFSKHDISLSSDARAKLRIFETDTSRELLGLSSSDYEWLVQNGTHIVHNAWPMSGTRGITAFESQFQTMRNLLDLARDAACQSSSTELSGAPYRIGFQLVTSIGVIGHSGQSRVVEDRVPISSVLPTGYCEGKWVCERMLDETLHQYPTLFRAMVARPGQIAGSTSSGAWNTIEHFAFIVKSAQTLCSWPDFDGIMQWIPIDAAAHVMPDLLHIDKEADAPEAYPVYHIDNPVGQPWKELSPVLAEALGILADRIEPFRD
ncbi:hypothetical protein N7463_007355 [Penicillium fimorum]|uniref:Polyketide synthase n=1 Tax=Penicillium fimorum TaxID=1882269 RepID=A0A9W9XXG8_9EURO|nr:hypothetical protein N7463_007355 [Penicillium fimorum]